MANTDTTSGSQTFCHPGDERPLLKARGPMDVYTPGSFRGRIPNSTFKR